MRDNHRNYINIMLNPLSLSLTSAMLLAAISLSAQNTGVGNPSLSTLADKLASVGCLSGTVKYEVSLPSAPEPVLYQISLYASPNPGDTLAPCNYLIEWTNPETKLKNSGFNAYFGGNHFRYRNLKLQEYHFAEDPIPFKIGKTNLRGVQNQAQFTELLPAYLAKHLRLMQADTASYVCSLREVGDVLVLSGKYRINGYDANEYEYRFDARTGLPVSISFVYNPASITEQTVDAYAKWETPEDCPEISEQALLSKFPEVFEKFRTSNFKAESLMGQPLPAIVAPTTTGERYSRQSGDNFRQPTLIAFIDPETENAAATIDDIRNGLAQNPVDVDIVWIFTDSNNDKIENLMGPISSGEHYLTNARKAIRECGIVAFPTILFCGSDGMVKDMITGFNKNFTSIVIQKTALID